MDEIKRSIDSYVRASFPAGDVLSVTVSAPYESYGALDMVVMDVTITVRGTSLEVAHKEPPGFVSGMRTRLAELGEEAFPLVGLRSTEVSPRPA